MNDKEENDLDAQARGYIRTHVDLVLACPEPGEEWTLNEVEDIPTMGSAYKIPSNLEEAGVIEKTGSKKSRETPSSTTEVTLWRTSEEHYRFAEDIREDQETFECGHRAGISTDSDGKPYCGFWNCTYEIQSSDEVEEVYG